MTAKKQAIVDAFYKQHGPCCAGCDWWRWHNTVAGECIRTVPVSGVERIAMLGITGTSLRVDAGHIMTRREHVCGEFRDTDGLTANALAQADAACGVSPGAMGSASLVEQGEKQ